MKNLIKKAFKLRQDTFKAFYTKGGSASFL